MDLSSLDYLSDDFWDAFGGVRSSEDKIEVTNESPVPRISKIWANGTVDIEFSQPMLPIANLSYVKNEVSINGTEFPMLGVYITPGEVT